MRDKKIKAPGLPALITGAVLALVSVPTMLISTDPGLSRKVLVLAIAGMFALSVGAVQFFSYALKSEKAKQAYRDRWASRALFHSLLIVAVSDGELSDEDVSYIKKAYRKTFYKDIDDQEIRKIAHQVYSNPKVFLKDIKLYSNRIELIMREHIIKSCIKLAAENDELDSHIDVLKKLIKSLRVEANYLDIQLLRIK